MSPFTRPELVVRRCDELLSVNQPLAALSSISEVFSSKRFRTTPLSTLEPILVKFLGLCVDLRKGRTAKEGLHMYKNVAQNTSVGSVEVVVQKFLEQSRDKLTEALAKVEELEGPSEKATDSDGHLIADVEDLEASETPESILLSSVSEEKSRDRTYRTLVTPWLRFLWEAYRTALDILRNNARLEVLYQTVSHEAFQFCLTHQRKTEFRRLSETLRSHLTSSQKYSHQSHSLNLNDPDTLQRHLDTRFQQLNTAVDLELWQEAFRTAEDIHGLVGMSKRAPKASMMAIFYEKMVKVFGVGQNYLFHAAAYGKLYSLHAARAAVSGDRVEDAELEQLSSLVLLSALAVPIGSGLLGEGGKRREAGEEGEAKGKLGRLAALLALAASPTREGLITDALNRNVLKRVSPELRDLYTILEVDFHPLSITAKIEPILAALASKPETARYVEPLKDVVLARLFQQLSQVYASLKIDRVVKLASFATDGEKETTRKRVERFITEACRRGDLDVTIDHASGSIKFDEDLFGSDSAPVASTSTAYDVKTLQPSASALLRTHLTRLASTLYATLDIVSPHNSPVASALASRALAFAALESQGTDERDTLIARTQIIKRRKELADVQTARKEKEDAHERTVRAAQKAEETAKKQKDDVIRREHERIKKELDAQRRAEIEKTIKAITESSGTSFKIDAKTAEDPQAVLKIRIDQLESEKKSLAQKLTGVSKRIDHLERAFRKEEIPLLKQDYERQQTRDREAHSSTQAAKVDALRKQHTDDLAIKARLSGMMADYHLFKSKTEQESRAAFEREAERKKEQLEEAKQQRRADIREEREREKAYQAQREQEEAEERAHEEEQARLNAAADAAEQAEKDAIEARQRKLDEDAKAKRDAVLAEREAQRAADQAMIAKRQAIEDEAAARSGRPRAVAGPPVVGSASWKATQSASSERPKFVLAPRLAPVVAAPAPIAVASSEAPSRPIVAAPPAVGGARPSWRDKEAARANGTAAPVAAPVAAAPAPAGPPQVGGGKWSSARRDAPAGATEDAFRRPSGPGTPPTAGGAYKAPGRGNGEGESRWGSRN